MHLYYIRLIKDESTLGIDRRKARCAAVTILAGLAALVFGFTGRASADACPNEALRARQASGVVLPDCRAYEQVTPVEKNGNDPELGYVAQAAPSGDAITFFSLLPFDVPITGAPTFPSYLATRDAGGWSTQGVDAPPAPGEVKAGGEVAGWSEDLSEIAESTSGANLPGAVAGREFYLRDSATGVYRRVVQAEARLDSVTPDGSYVLFESEADLGVAGAAAGKSNLYEWDAETGQLGLVGVLPESEGERGAAPAGGSIAGPYGWLEGRTEEPGVSSGYYLQDVISSDGSRVFFTADGTGQLYVREDPLSASARTVHVSASQKTNGAGIGGTDPDGPQPAAFMAATPDGSDVFFTSHEELTNDANTGPGPGIGRANLDGSEAQPIFIPASAQGIAVNSEYVYWADPKQDSIGRARIDGSEIEQSFITGARNPQYVAVYGDYVYWTNAGEGKQKEGSIGRAKIGAGGAEQVEQGFITGASDPQGIAVSSEYIYWANIPESFSKRTIARAKIDGEGVELTGFVTKTETPGGVAVSSEYVYWTVPSGNEIGRAPIAGGKGTAGFITGASDPQGIAVNSEYIYSANAAEGKEKGGSIARSPIAGGAGEPPLITGASEPHGVAVDAAHVYWQAGGGDDGEDLYRYESASGAGALTDLTPDPGDPDGAEVLGVLGTSENGDYVYFAANGVLASNEGAEGSHAASGDCVVSDPNAAATCNLYLWHDGETTFIAPLRTGGSAPDWYDWTPTQQVGSEPSEPRSARVTPTGTVLLFSSNEKDTGYENKGHAEFYRYEASSEDHPSGLLACVSCDPAGVEPPESVGGGALEDRLFIPPPSAFGLSAPAFLTRNLSADGSRVFFDSSEQLLAQDVDERGVRNVYEWEAAGAGSCEVSSTAFSAVSGGCLYLLSTGQSSEPSYFVDASVSGDDAFIDTSQPLVAEDGDALYDIYDARVDGGIAAQNERPGSCQGEGCLPPVSPPPVLQAPISEVLSGSGNLTPPSEPKSAGAVLGAKAKKLTRAQELTKALKACEKMRKKKERRACEAVARRRYGTARGGKHKTSKRAGAKSTRRGGR